MADVESNKLDKIVESLREKLFPALKSILKSEAVKIGSVVFIAIILLVFICPLFLDNSALKFQITQKVSQISGANLTIKGDVKIALLPSPKIIAQDVLLQNYKPKSQEKGEEKIYNLYAKEVEIHAPLFVMMGDSFANQITFIDAILESYYETNQSLARQDDLTQIITDFLNNPTTKTASVGSGISEKIFPISDVDSSQFNISAVPTIVIQNGHAIFYDKFARKKEVSAINADLEISEEEIFADGNFQSEKITSNFKLVAKFNSTSSSPTSSLEIISPVLELRVKGNFISANKGILDSDFRGKVEAEIFELKSCYKSYITSNGFIAGKLKYNAKPLKVSADVENISKEIAITNFAITSDLANGKGDINLSFAENFPMADISFVFDNIDLDNIWSGDAVALDKPIDQNKITMASRDEKLEVVPTPQSPATQDQAQSTTTTETAIEAAAEGATEEKKIQPIDFDLTKKIKDIDLEAEITIKNIKYLEGEIKDTSLYMTVSSEGQIMILPLIFRIPGEGIFRVNGALDNSAAIPKFVGKVDANGKNLQDVFKWLKIESQNLKYESLREYSLYCDVLLLPNIVTLNNLYLNINNGDSEFLGESKIESSDKVTNITSSFEVSNFDVDNYFLTSGQNIYLSPGLLLKKMLWLNDITTDNDLSIKFNKLIYKKEEFPQQSVKLKFGRGYLAISDLKLKSDNTDLTANMNIDISDKNPHFDIDIKADNFHYETTQKSELVVEEIHGAKPKVKNFFDQFYALPSLEGFSGKVALDLANLKIDETEIKDLKLNGKLKDGNIEKLSLTLGLYGGDLDYKGTIGIKLDKIINGNLTFSNVVLEQFLSKVFGINNISGVANISANITSVANKRSDFGKQLSSEVKFSANAPSIKGYGLNDLVKKMFAPQIYHSELQDPEKILINSDATTIFKQANGTIQINNGKDGRMRANVTAPAVNAILSGTVDAGNMTIDALFNAIFLTGNRQKQTPINIATNIKGPTENISQNTNLDQVKQYLGLMKTTKTVTQQEMQAPLFPQNQASQLQAAPTQQIQPTYQQAPLLPTPTQQEPQAQNPVLMQLQKNNPTQPQAQPTQ